MKSAVALPAEMLRRQSQARKADRRMAAGVIRSSNPSLPVSAVRWREPTWAGPHLKSGNPAGVCPAHVWLLPWPPTSNPIMRPNEESFFPSARQTRSCRGAAATRRAGPSRPQRRLRLQTGSERSLAVRTAGGRARVGPCSEHPERAFRAAFPQELSADCRGSDRVSGFRTAGPAAEPNAGGCRIGATAFRGAGPVHVHPGQEDRSHVPAVVPEPVPGAAAHVLDADDPLGDAVRIAGVSPVDGRPYPALCSGHRAAG